MYISVFFIWAFDVSDIYSIWLVELFISTDSNTENNRKHYLIANATIGMYDNAPDPRDGVVPGCSTDSFSTNEDACAGETSSSTQDLSADSESNVQFIPVKRRKGRSFEAITQHYAESMKDVYEKIQNKITKENQIYIE